MRYEVMRLLQFVFSLALMFAAFMGGMFVGWRRWGRSRPADLADAADEPSLDRPAQDWPTEPAPRRDLFAPELDLTWEPEDVDLRVGPAPTQLGLPAAPSDEALAARLRP